MSSYGGGNNNYQAMPPTTPSRDNSTSRTGGYGGTSPSPIQGDPNRGARSPDFSPSPGSNVLVTKRVVEPDRSYLETLKKTIEDNMAEEARLRQDREQLMRENQMLQQQLANGNSSPAPAQDPAYESNLQRNMMLKSEIADLQRRLDRERENQRKSLGFQEQRAREFEDRIRAIEMENNQLKNTLTTSNEKESQLRMLTSENQRLKDELFRTGDPQKLDTLKIIQENSQLKARISQLEKELAVVRQEKEQLDRTNAAQSLGKSDKLMKELRRLNEDNVTLYDDNKLLMRQNQMLKNEIDEFRRGLGGSSQTGTPGRDPNSEMQLRKMQDSMNLLMQENRNLSSELSMLKSRPQGSTHVGSSIEDQNTINRLRAELASKDRELSDMRMKFPRLESDLRNLQGELKMASQNAQDNGDKVRQLTGILSQRDEEIRRLSQNQGSASAANTQQMQQVIRAKDEEIANLSRSRFELENRANNAENEARMQRATAESMRTQLNNLMQAQNGSSTEINNLRRRVKELEIERDEAGRRGNPADENLLRQKEFLEKELDRKLQREKRIETELTKLRNEVELLIEERDTFKKKYKEGDTAREALERENHDLRRRPVDHPQNDMLINELRNRDAIIADQNAQILSFKQQLQAPRAEPSALRELENKINYLVSENSKLKFELENFQKMEDSSFKTKYLIDDLNRKVSALEIEKERSDQRLRDKDAEVRTLQDSRRMERDEIENNRTMIRKMQDRINQLEQERNMVASRDPNRVAFNDPSSDALRQEAKAANDKLNAAREENLRLRDELQARDGQLNKLNMELQKRDFELRSIASEKDRLNQELQRLSGMRDRINETAVLEEKINGYKAEINNLRERMLSLERTLLDKDTEIASLRREVQTGGAGNAYMSEKDMQSGQKLIYQTQLLELKQENSSLNSKILILKQENENLSRVAKERLLELENIKVTTPLTSGGDADPRRHASRRTHTSPKAVRSLRETAL